MNILLLNSQKNNTYIRKLKRILESNNDDKLIIYKKKIKLDYIKKNKINLIISFHYKYFVPLDVLKFLKFNAFNFHNSNLPLNKGMYPILWSAVSNQFATCLHQMTKRVDDGDIVFKKKIKIKNNKSLYFAYHLLEKNSIESFKKIWKNLRKKILYNQKLYLKKQSRNIKSYNNNLKSQILLSTLPDKWFTEIKYVQKNFKNICKLFKS